MSQETEQLKQEYNALLERFKKGEKFFNSCSDEEYKKYQPAFADLISKLDEKYVRLKDLGLIDKDNILGGVK